jgi:hypothetical protein
MAQTTRAIEQVKIKLDKNTYHRDASDVLCECVKEIVAHKPSMHMQMTMVSTKLGPSSFPNDLAKLKATTARPGTFSVNADSNSYYGKNTY